jgi:hypothetical protein
VIGLKRKGMKSSYDFGEDQEHFFTAEDMSRREFLKVGVGLVAVASSFEMIAGCATTEAPKVMTSVYPPLPYSKEPRPQGGVLYFDNTWRLTGDHTLSPKSLGTLKEVFKDPYWIMVK